VAVAFAGELVNEVAPVEGATCAPTGAAACPAPCRMRWTLSGSR
jgi:hypothetical protein